MEDNKGISQELLEIIERFINGSMTSQELKDFNQLLELDDDFKNKVEDVKTMLSGIESKSKEEQLAEPYQDISETNVKKSIENKVGYFNINKIATAVAIIIAVVSIWFFSTPQNEKLYDQYFKPDPGFLSSKDSTYNFDFYDAMLEYKRGNYNIAIDKWQTLSEEKPQNDTLNYFLGVAHLTNNNAIEAIPFFERMVQSKDSFPFINNAHHYLGLAYLKEGNTELARKHLSLSNTDNGKELISKLDD